MSNYQVIARKFRPQTFEEVVGQEAIVTTLKNAIKFNRLAQAYLFCGSRGTGKTTLARLLAKALNCSQLTLNQEPCNQCPSCLDISQGSSLDVLEIDGASHRGVEDVRQINETIGYVPTSGKYKIYLIDEVHMLTKEAFNALLKTLEEPPAHVKFLFATTEPHKVLSTILSRCQRFNLSRLSPPQIVFKLEKIANSLNVHAEKEALQLLARLAEGGLRDAESLFDQMLAFTEEATLTLSSVQTMLGLTSKEVYFEIDLAGKQGLFEKAFEIAHQLFSEGKDLAYFIDGLIEHFRNILLFQLSGKESPLLTLADRERQAYEQSSSIYSQEQCLDLIEYLLNFQNQPHFLGLNKFSIESLILHIMRSHFKLPIEYLVQRLSELEQSIDSKQFPASIPTSVNLQTAISPPSLPPTAENLSITNQPKEKPTLANQSTEKPSEQPLHYYDTLFQFAAVEFGGKLQKN